MDTAISLTEVKSSKRQRKPMVQKLVQFVEFPSVLMQILQELQSLIFVPLFFVRVIQQRQELYLGFRKKIVTLLVFIQ